MSALFVVQSFSKIKGGVRADQPMQVSNALHAARVAERLSGQKAAVIAIVTSGDPSTGLYGDPKLLVMFGEVPEEVLEMERAP